jgi:F0F1-type ATP synthase assembly protein I
MIKENPVLQARLVSSPRVQASERPSFAPAEAGMVLIAAVAICATAGALVGWAVGSVGIGVLVGVVVGLPAGVASVYRRFRGYFS